MKLHSEFEFLGTERYAIKRRVGHGAMGVVYEAYDKQREARIALKTLRHADAKALYRFKNEFRALQDIQHPNLVQLGELVSADGTWFFTMEFVEGIDFIRYVRPDNRFDEGRLRNSLGQLAQGLAALHAAHKIHRDIKPSNVLVTSQGRVVLLDFGLVTGSEEDEQSVGSTVVGTANYMAPEQAWAETIGPPADWYSFGVLLYEALAGRRPHQGKSPIEVLMRKQQHIPKPPSAWVRGVPEDLDRICQNLLDRDPLARPKAPTVLRDLGLEHDVAIMQQRRGLQVQVTSQRDKPFVGRQDELSALHQAARDSVSHAVTLFVRGESGVGKSELVQQFTRHLQQTVSDVVVLSGRCYERESVPFKAFDGIADSLSHYMVQLPKAEAAALLPLRASLLPELFPVLRRVEAIASAPKEERETIQAHERRLRMFQALRELFRRLAQRRPVVLSIDDFQWADVDSMTLLDELMLPPEEPRVLLLATMRPPTDEHQQNLLERMNELPGDVRHLDLDVLPPEGAKALVRLLSPEISGADPAIAASIAEEAGGHPMFIHELVLYLKHEGTTTGASRLDDALWARIGRLEEPARLLIELLAVAGMPITHEIASNAIEMRYADYEQAASVLRIAHLARTGGARQTDSIETYHDRLRAAIVSQLADEKRRHYHARLAIALDRAGAASTQPQALVRHLEAAGEEANAADHAEKAARQATRASAFDQAAELYRTALRLSANAESKQRELKLSLGGALVKAGRGPEAADVFLEAAKGADSVTRLECHRQAAEQLLISGHIERGLETLELLLREMGLHVQKTPGRALLSLLWHRFKLRLRGMRWKERHHTQISPENLIRLDVYKSVSHGLAVVDVVRAADFNSRYLLYALRIGEPRRVGRAFAIEIAFLSAQGGTALARARKMVGAVSDIAERTGDTELPAWTLIAKGSVEYFSGEFTKGAETFAQAEEEIRKVMDTRFELNNMQMFRILCLRFAGDWALTRRLVETYIRDASRRGDRYLETTLRRYSTFLWLAADDTDGARDNLSRATWTPPEGRFHVQHWFELEASVELALYEKRALAALDEQADAFDKLYSSLLPRTQIIHITAMRLRGRLYLASIADGADKTAALKQTETMARQLDRQKIDHATLFARLLRVGIALQQKKRERAIELLQSSTDEALRLEMKLLHAASMRRLGELLREQGGADLIIAADEMMQQATVCRPAEIARMIIPGFPGD